MSQEGAGLKGGFAAAVLHFTPVLAPEDLREAI